jgi:4a-hydroxytetrahydrobiopterin dehydratase
MLNVELSQKRCLACEGGAPALTNEEIKTLLGKIAGWELAGKTIKREFRFKNYYHTMAFVNAIAWLAHQENHHPDLEIGYNYCRVIYSTHSIDGLSENDFICAAKVNALQADISISLTK